MIFGERREEVGRRQLLLAGLEVQLIAARRIRLPVSSWPTASSTPPCSKSCRSHCSGSTALRQYSERFDEDVYAAIALTNCVTGRTSLGGTCVASVEAQIASVRDFLAGQTEAAKQARNG